MAELREHNKHSIAFIDTEIDFKSKKILDIGCVKENDAYFHKNSIADFVQFIKGTQFICGHNIIHHDIKYIGNTLMDAGIDLSNLIDTLYLSPLLFPTKPYHSLLKDDKLQSEEVNNPLNDSIKAKDLLNDEIATFQQIDDLLKQIFYLLLKNQKEFRSFFHYVSYRSFDENIEQLIRKKFKDEICEQADLSTIIAETPVELAYCLSLIHSFIQHKKIHSITPPWVLKNYPKVERIMFQLRNKSCLRGCEYCDNALDARKGLKKFFGFDAYRSYDGEPLQEQAVKAAINNKSIIVVFPTGGGKSITFQVPALMSGENANALTIVISPLQSLMKDQVDNLEKAGITDAVTINGLLDPIERAKCLERVGDGSVSILYISPELLRSKTIERLILGRKIARFVIDEAHCFSSWGQDFRVDYLYIGDFIKSIQEKKNITDGIPVSCFTATAKQKVIEDIQNYFKEKLSIELELFTSKASRTNLQYKVFPRRNDEEKYQTVRDLIEEKNCPTIIYVSRTQKAYKLAERLSSDGFSAKPYHGKMDKQEKSKNQDAFINGNVQIMVATSAFGMGVDKKDIGMVIHFEISDSLENYVQEAGRAGRDEKITADCFVLFNEDDLSKHFILLNQTKLSIKEIQQVWKAIKEITKFRSTVSNSALEIARKAGWDDQVVEIETRVITAIAALEDAGYLRRGQNMPQIFANSILSKNAQEAIDKINASEKFVGKQKEKGIRIIRKLLSSKSRKQSNGENGESRIDYISDHLGIVKEEVINIVNLLREEEILADAKDLTAYIKKGENSNRSLGRVETFNSVENFLLPLFDKQERTFHLKELNEQAEENGFADIDTYKIKTILNFWAIKNWIKRKNLSSKNHVTILSLHSKEYLKTKLERRHILAQFIIEFLYERSNEKNNISVQSNSSKEEGPIEFSVHELKYAYENSSDLFKIDICIDDIEEALFYLSKIEAIKIEGGFLVVYNRLTLERTESDNKKRYTKEDYQKLNQFYENKIQQIHIVGEYAKKMIADYKSALQFTEDYFQLNYLSFLNKYFKGNRQNEIKQNITPAKFKQLFGELSPTQLKIINDSESKHIVVAAGPGSGKTKVLVHKLASLLLMEDVKHEQLLMITFSRVAATEFKSRLMQLIGNAAHYIEIKTFHSYCFDLLGKVGSLEKSDEILKTAIQKIQNHEVEPSRITKTVLVIDEAQDMNEEEFHLIRTMMTYNEEMRVIAVGDDDQNIYGFRGASSMYMEQLITNNNAIKYELVENYRSNKNLIDFTNQFVNRISHRLKQTPIITKKNESGHIRIFHYQNGNLILPLVQDVLTTNATGTTCILTKTNEEALQITGLLLLHGLRAKLIQSNDGFSLYNLNEVRYFLNQLHLTENSSIVSNDVWINAKRAVVNQYRHNPKLEIIGNIIKEFEKSNPKRKYKSDLEIFIRESKIEDFYTENHEIIHVSTVHKAKGKEFVNVFLLLDNVSSATDDEKRLLYVAMTRAKTNLTVHLNSNFLDTITADHLERIEDMETHSKPNQLVMHLFLKDVWLDFFIFRQDLISQLQSGDLLTINDENELTFKEKSVVKFSKQFIQQIGTMKSKGYVLKNAKVNFIVFWKKEEIKQEIRIVLPELYFDKQISF